MLCTMLDHHMRLNSSDWWQCFVPPAPTQPLRSAWLAGGCGRAELVVTKGAVPAPQPLLLQPPHPFALSLSPSVSLSEVD